MASLLSTLFAQKKIKQFTEIEFIEVKVAIQVNAMVICSVSLCLKSIDNKEDTSG